MSLEIYVKVNLQFLLMKGLWCLGIPSQFMTLHWSDLITSPGWDLMSSHLLPGVINMNCKSTWASVKLKLWCQRDHLPWAYTWELISSFCCREKMTSPVIVLGALPDFECYLLSIWHTLLHNNLQHLLLLHNLLNLTPQAPIFRVNGLIHTLIFITSP